MLRRTRVLEVVFLLALVAGLVFCYHGGGSLTVEGVAPGMTSAQVDEAVKNRKDRPWITWGSDSRVERVEGSSLEQGGRYVLGSRATYSEIVQCLGRPDRERTHQLHVPGGSQEALQLLYRQERLSVERSVDGVVTYELL